MKTRLHRRGLQLRAIASSQPYRARLMPSPSVPRLPQVRAFDGGPEEATFVLVHAEIESKTPELIAAYDAVIAALGTDGPLPAPTPEAVAAVTAGLSRVRQTMERIVVSQLKMFTASDPRNYEKFVRPWIFGWKGA